MLPSFLQSSYGQYKADSDFVATWLARTAERCGYPKESLLSQTEQPPKPPKLKGRARKLARDAAQQSSKAVQNRNPATETTRKSSKYLIAIGDFITLAEWIVKAATPPVMVPTSFVSVLDRAIAVRKRHHDWWSSHEICSEVNTGNGKEANAKHQFFIRVLERVREILRPAMCKEPASVIGAAITDEKKETSSSLPNLFAGLTVEQPDESLSVHAVPQAEPSSSSDPQEEYTAGQEQDIEEVYFAVHCLFNDLDNIRRYLMQVWQGYKVGAFDLVAASITTNTAIDFAKRLQDDFKETFPQHTDFEQHIKVLYVQQCLAYGEDYRYKERPDDEMNFNIYTKVEPLMFSTYMLLSSFIDVIESTSLPIYKTGHFGTYNASSNRSQKSARDKFREDKIVLLEVLPEFCVLARYPKTIPAEDNFTCGMREMIKTKKVSIALVLATQIFLDVHHILRDQIVTGFSDLVKSAQYVANNIERAQEFHKDLRVDTWPQSNDQVLRQILERISTWVQSDSVQEMRMSMMKRSVNQVPPSKPFFMMKQHPLYCGLLSYSIKALALDAAIAFANAWGSILYCAHLYNAVRQEKLLTDVWPDMNLALFMHKTEDMFVGDLPKSCSDYFSRFCLAMGYSASNFAKNKRPGRPAASKSGPRALNDLAPVSNKFKARFCYDDERGDLLPSDVEAILAEYADTCDDDEFFDDGSNEWVIPRIQINAALPPDMDDSHAAAKKPKSKGTGKRLTRSVASGVKPIEVLNALLNAIQSESLELTFDHFRLHTFCWRLLRNIQTHLDDDLRKIYGAGYLEKENQLPWIVGCIFMTASETSRLAGVLLPKKKEIVTSRLLQMAAGAIKTMIDSGAGAMEIGMLRKQFGTEVDMDDLLGEVKVSADGDGQDVDVDGC